MTLPRLVKPSDESVPPLRTTRRLTRKVARCFDALIRLEVTKAGLAVATLQGIERAAAANLAGAPDVERRQLALAKRRAATLAGLLRKSPKARAALVRAWHGAGLPNPRLGADDLAPFRKSARAIRARLVRLGLPEDLVRAGMRKATVGIWSDVNADGHIVQRTLLSGFKAASLGRSESLAASALDDFARSGQ
jgi:hypothetical protein